jgi:ATP-dependent exoDNAse (exonuclease V) beta subunit
MEILQGNFLCHRAQSKGLEFDQVWLTDDYFDFYSRGGKELEPEEIEQEEVNVLHVAVTCAKAAIRICNPSTVGMA